MMCWKNECRHVQIDSKHKLQVNISERNCPISDTMIYYVSVLLYVITWPSGKLRVYVDAFKALVHQPLRRANVILVFDRYFPNSIKTFTRTQRSGSSRVYKLTPDYAGSSEASRPHQHQKQDSTECHVYRRHSRPRLLHRSNTDAYHCRCPRCAS